MKREIYSIPGKLVTHYHSDTRTIIDTWTDMSVSLEEWKSTIYDIGIMNFAAQNGAKAWITDTSNAKGVFNRDIQEFRAKTSAAAMEKSGIKCFFTVLPQSAISKLAAYQTSKNYAGHGSMTSHTVNSLDEAFAIRKQELGY